jgi:Zn finger protein HypA/HybF involved in hydrogenase expression
MTGKYLLYLCKATIKKPHPKSIIVRYRPFVEEELIGIDHDFRELVKGTIYEKLNITFRAGRSGGICKTCGHRRNFLHAWESCKNCGSPAICVDHDPTKQLQIISVDYEDRQHDDIGRIG